MIQVRINTERHLRTPTVTRSYRSREKIRLEKMYDIHKMLRMLEPVELELEAIVLSAATIGAIQRKSGEYGDPRLPAPVDHIDDLFGYSDPEEPTWRSRQERDRSVLMLRCVDKMRKYLDEWLQGHTHTLVNLVCPKCGKHTIDAIKGPRFCFVDGEVDTYEDEDCMLDLTITCECATFSIQDILELELQALT